MGKDGPAPSPRDTVASYHVQFGQEIDNTLDVSHHHDDAANKHVSYKYSAPSYVYDDLPGHRQQRPYIRSDDERVRLHEGKTSSDGIRIAASCDLDIMRFQNGDESYHSYQQTGAAFDRAIRAHLFAVLRVPRSRRRRVGALVERVGHGCNLFDVRRRPLHANAGGLGQRAATRNAAAVSRRGPCPRGAP